MNDWKEKVITKMKLRSKEKKKKRIKGRKMNINGKKTMRGNREKTRKKKDKN